MNPICANDRGKATRPDERVVSATVQRHTGDVRTGRAVGGGAPDCRKNVQGMGAVTALSTSGNNGDWTGRIMRKNRGVNRRVTVTFADPAALRAARGL